MWTSAITAFLEKCYSTRLTGEDVPDSTIGRQSTLLFVVCLVVNILLVAHWLQPRRESNCKFHLSSHVMLGVSSLLAMAFTIAIALCGVCTSVLLTCFLQELLCFTGWLMFSTAMGKYIQDRASYLTLDLRLVGIALSASCISKLPALFAEENVIQSAQFWLAFVRAICCVPIVLVVSFYWPAKIHKRASKVQQKSGEGPENPFEYASWISKIWYVWYTRLIVKGYKHQLVAEDVFELESNMTVEVLRERFDIEWNKELRKQKNVSLIRVLWRCYSKRIIHAVILKAIYDAISFAPPLLLNEMLKWIQNNHGVDEVSKQSGYLIASLMVLAVIVLPILENSYFYVVYRTGICSRSCLVDAVQRKALVISPSARESIGTGSIMNHLTKDAEMLERVYNSINYLWSAPVRIIVALYLLNQLVGYAAFLGFLTILVVFPFQGLASKLVGIYRKAALKWNDERVSAMSEMISGIRIVKFYAWEESCLGRILSIRTKELQKLLRLAYSSCVNIVLFNVNPILIAVVVFTVYSRHGNLTANVAFTALSLLDIVRFPMMMLPGSITVVIEARVALKRLSTYLAAEEIPRVSSKGETTGTICMDGVCLGGKGNDLYRIRDITLKIFPGQLVSIVGRTGCGKSSLLSAIVGDSEISKGRVTVDGKVSYVSQQSWIMNNTVQENILFGAALNEDKLNAAIQACQLEKDVAAWPGGLQQEIGERGLNLSGGQKQRVSLARAVYAESDIVLLDDPLSALDAKVGHDVFLNCICKSLCERTRLLVTSQMHFLHFSDWVIFMDEGEIKAQGRYQDICIQNPSFATFAETKQITEDSQTYTQSEDYVKNIDATVESTSLIPVNQQNRQVVEEYRRRGTSFTWEYLKAYCQASGGLWVLAVAMCLFACRQALNVLSSWWLSKWAGNAFQYNNGRWVAGYGLFALAQALTEFFAAVFTANRGITAAKHIHESMLRNILHLPITFYDSNPSGRILNRVTKDQANMDDGLTWQLNVTMKCIFGVVGTITAITFVSPLFLLVACPVIVVFYWIQNFYRCSVRELKRLESTTRSPIYSFFGETLSGIGIIRAYGKEEYRIGRLAEMVNHNQKFILANMTANRWLNMRLEGLGAVVVLATSFFAVANFEKIGPELIGFALNYAFTITSNMSIVILVYSEAEKGFTSVERILEYTKLRPEFSYKPLDLKNRIWPSQGKIEYRSVTLAYKENLPAVLKQVSFVVRPGHKVGIVGRTGSGKSSMILSLFRMIDIREGQIFIDDVDICKVELKKLRTSMAIIPQDPIIFAGTIKSNLDPFNLFSEKELVIALGRANLDELSINTVITEAGGNLSVGQRQLLCLARALLLKTKILILDEATASVDPQTDKILQDTIRRELGKQTILVIAHRLHTVVDADFLLLLDNGYLVESGSPIELYEKKYRDKKQNLFRELVEQYGDEKEALISKMQARAATNSREKYL